MSKPTQGSTFKPPVPPRPQVKIPLPSADTPNQAELDIIIEKPQKVFLLPPPVDKPAEKQMENLDHL